MKAIILAAGYATRLKDIAADRPKALLPIGTRPILEFLMDQLAVLPALDGVIIVSNHRFISQFRTWLATAASKYPTLTIEVLDDGTVSNEDRLGAVGDIQFAIEKTGLDDDLLVAAADNFFTFPLLDFVDDFLSHGCDTICATRMDDLAMLQRVAVATLSENRRVTALVEKPRNPPTDVGVFALYLYRADTVPLFKQYLQEGRSPDSPGHFPEWLYTRKEVRAFLFEGECFDIGTPEAYREICERFGED